MSRPVSKTAVRIAAGSALLSWLVAACSVQGAGSKQRASDADSAETSATDTTDVNGEGEADDAATDTTDEAGEDDSGCDFLGCDHDMPGICGSSYAGEPGLRALDSCDVWQQDCPTDERCTPVDACGTGVVDALVCVGPGSTNPGSPCEIGDGPIGTDTCNAQSVCMGAGQNGPGTCVELCVGPESSPLCTTPDTRCVAYFGGLLPLCVPACDPLSAEPCDQPETACLATGFDDANAQTGTASCVPIDAPTGSQPGDPCAGLGWCDEGQACIRTGWAQQLCGATGCCEELCELGGSACGVGYDCVDFHDDDHPTLGYCSPA